MVRLVIKTKSLMLHMKFRFTNMDTNEKFCKMDENKKKLLE